MNVILSKNKSIAKMPSFISYGTDVNKCMSENIMNQNYTS